MLKYTSIVFFLIFSFISSFRLKLREKPLKDFCSSANQFFIEPYDPIFRDTVYTFGLIKSFFIGTGEEFHTRGHGKIVLRERIKIYNKIL